MTAGRTDAIFAGVVVVAYLAVVVAAQVSVAGDVVVGVPHVLVLHGTLFVLVVALTIAFARGRNVR